MPHHLNASNSFLTATLHVNTPVFISIMAWDTKTSRQNSGAVVAPSTSAGPLTRADPPPPVPFSSAGTPVENTRSAQITPPEPPQKATWLDVARQYPKLDMTRSHTQMTPIVPSSARYRAKAFMAQTHARPMLTRISQTRGAGARALPMRTAQAQCLHMSRAYDIKTPI